MQTLTKLYISEQNIQLKEDIDNLVDNLEKKEAAMVVYLIVYFCCCYFIQKSVHKLLTQICIRGVRI